MFSHLYLSYLFCTSNKKKIMESPDNPFSIHHDAKMPTRDTLMSLSSIKPGQDYRVTKTSYVHKPLDVSDIDGAQPRHREYHPYVQEEIDVGKHKSITSVNKPDHILSCKDIEGAYPSPSKQKSKRVVDPLEPDYKLPSYTPAPPPDVPFLRDTLNVTDIKGTSSKPLYPGEPKPVTSLTVIPNTVVPPRPMRTYTLDTSDINTKPKKFIRDSNPCDPTYQWDTDRVWRDPTHIKPNPTGIERLPSTMQSNDIQGAYVKQSEVHDVRNTNYVGDIPGAYNPKHLAAAGSPGMQKSGYILERVEYVKEEDQTPIEHPKLPNTEHKAGIKFIPKKERTFSSEVLKTQMLPGPSLDKYSNAKVIFNRTSDPELKIERELGDPTYHVNITGKTGEGVGGNTIYVNTTNSISQTQMNPSFTYSIKSKSPGGQMINSASQVYSRSDGFKTRTRADIEKELVASLPRY